MLPAPFPPQHQRGETLSYLLAFALLTPLALLAAHRLAPALASARGDAGLSRLTALLCAALLAALVLVKASERVGGSGGVLPLLAAALVWWVLAAAVVARALRPRPARGRGARAHARAAWAVVAA